MGMVVGLSVAGVAAITLFGVFYINWYSTDEDLGVADYQLIDVDRLRNQARNSKAAAATTRA
jgi:hypothetical protein